VRALSIEKYRKLAISQEKQGTARVIYRKIRQISNFTKKKHRKASVLYGVQS
jgi:hypothetical protein